MQDVSEDSSMINWLRQAGHGHLIEDQLRHAQNNSSPPLSNPSYGQNTSSQNYPPQPTSLSSPGMDALNRSGSFSLTDYNQQPTYGAAGSPAPPMISSLGNFDASSFNQQHSPLNFTGSPTQFLTPNLNDPQLDINIEVRRCLAFDLSICLSLIDRICGVIPIHALSSGHLLKILFISNAWVGNLVS